MLNVVLSNRFKKDLKTIAKRGYDLDLLDAVINTLAEQQPFPEMHMVISCIAIGILQNISTELFTHQ